MSESKRKIMRQKIKEFIFEKLLDEYSSEKFRSLNITNLKNKLFEYAKNP